MNWTDSDTSEQSNYTLTATLESSQVGDPADVQSSVVFDHSQQAAGLAVHDFQYDIRVTSKGFGDLGQKIRENLVAGVASKVAQFTGMNERVAQAAVDNTVPTQNDTPDINPPGGPELPSYTISAGESTTEFVELADMPTIPVAIPDQMNDADVTAVLGGDSVPDNGGIARPGMDFTTRPQHQSLFEPGEQAVCTVEIPVYMFVDVEQVPLSEFFDISGEPFDLGVEIDVGSWSGGTLPIDVDVTNDTVGDPGDIDISFPWGGSETRQLGPGESTSLSVDATPDDLSGVSDPANFTITGDKLGQEYVGSASLPSPPEQPEPSDGPGLEIEDVVPTPNGPDSPINVVVGVRNLRDSAQQATVEGPGARASDGEVPADSVGDFQFDLPAEEFSGESVSFGIAGTDITETVSMPSVGEPDIGGGDGGITINDIIVGDPSDGGPIPVDVVVGIPEGSDIGQVTVNGPGTLSNTANFFSPGETTVSFDVPRERGGETVTFAVVNGGASESVNLPQVEAVAGVGDLDISLDLPGNVTVGSEYGVVATITNQANSAVSGEATTGSGDFADTFSLQPGESYTFTDDVIPSETGPQTTTLFVDVGGDTIERTGTVTVEQLVSTPEPGSLGTATITVTEGSSASSFEMDVLGTEYRDDSYTATVMVENVPTAGGGVESQIEVSAEARGESTSATEPVSPGESVEYDIAVVDQTNQSAAEEMKVSFQQSGGGAGPESVTVDAPERKGEPDFQIFDIRNVPDEASPGETFSVEVLVDNLGDAPGEGAVILAGQTKPVEIPAIDTGYATFQVAMPPTSPTNFTVTAVYDDGRVADESTFAVASNEPSFTIDAVDAPSTVPLGEQFDVAVDIANNGGAEGTVNISALGGSETATIGAGEAQSVAFTDAADSPGTIPVTVEVTNQATGETLSEERAITTQVPSLSIASIDTPAEVSVGETFQADATVRNTGGAPSDGTVSVAGSDQTVTLGPGEASTVTADITADSPGEIPVDVAVSDDDTGESSSDTATTVAVAPLFEIESVAPPEEPVAGSSGILDVTVANTGDAAGGAVVTVDGTEYNAGSISPGASETVEHETSFPGTDTLAYTIVVEDATTGEVDDETEVTVSPSAPAFSIKRTDTPRRTQPGSDATVEAVVANTSDVAGPVTVSADGASRRGTLDPSSQRAFSIPVRKDESSSQNVTITATNVDTGAETTRSVTLRSSGSQDPQPEPTPSPQPQPDPEPRPQPQPQPEPEPRPPEDGGDDSFFEGFVNRLPDPLGVFDVYEE